MNRSSCNKVVLKMLAFGQSPMWHTPGPNLLSNNSGGGACELTRSIINIENLSIELIHPYSSKFRFYQPNLTHSDMIQRLLLSPRPKRRISSNNTLLNMKVILPVLKRTTAAYLARINLGTFSRQRPIHKEYHLHFDTGSDMIWLQCEDCAKPGNRCFQQKSVPYPNRGSINYVPLPCDRHPLCIPGQCIETHCSYMVEYDEGSISHEILAYETLTFRSSCQQRWEMVRVVIGYGHKNKMVQFTDDTGVFGMSWGTHSFFNCKHCILIMNFKVTCEI
uniref:Peptidase A1 domain-containing protein n=1 Tax=Kalanchoe fedtschenkoi TaxID=63787 RepID=A0A7N0RHQ7_KALFE